MTKKIVVLAMHGMPPKDFPRKELSDWSTLHNQLSGNIPNKEVIEKRYLELDAKIRQWPRTRDNDLYFFASQEIAEAFRKQADVEVLVGFNEFCAPSLDDVLDLACRKSKDVTVITPMMTRGGSHSEIDIPQAVDKAKKNHPQASIHYVWPFDVQGMAQFLIDQMNRKEKATA